MDYFSILNLNKEPFSNSPDPEYFFQSQQHLGCLQKLELSIRLKRGLNVVVGDVGTGKTTLCRQLIRNFAKDKNSETHLILDPYFSSPQEFLVTVAGLFEEQKSFVQMNEWQIKEAIKQYIFKRGVDENRIIILIIDEGQKIPEFCLEILREFLNFETNEYKLLQIVIFAQKEFDACLKKHANVADRINLYHLLEPLNFTDTRQMIGFRINQSSSVSKRRNFFSFTALWAIYRLTGGYPRKIVNLCHQIILAMIIQNRTRAGWFLVRSCARRVIDEPAVKWRRVAVASLVVIATASLAIGLAPEGLKPLIQRSPVTVQTQSAPVVDVKPVTVQTQSAPMVDVKPVTVQTQSAPVVDVKPVKVQTQSAPVVDVKKEAPIERAVENVKKVNLAKSAPEARPEKTSAALKATKAPEENLRPMERQHASISVPDENAGKLQEPPSEKAVSDAEPEMPSTLGRVALQRNENLWLLMKKVKGVCGPQDIRSVKQANPFIQNPNVIKAGRLITIPAVPVKIKPAGSDTWWVRIAEKSRLDEAIDILRQYPEDAPPIRLLPYWNRKELKFAILLRNPFSSQADADRELQRVPPDFAANATRLSAWPGELVFFADPYIRLKM